MNVFIAKIDYFDPDSWRVLAAPYGGQNQESSRKNITDVAHKLGDDGIALLVGSLSFRTVNRHKRKLLGAVRCHKAVYRTEEVVDARHLGSGHFTRADDSFRMPYCIPYSQLWVCRPPLIRAEIACEDEIVDPVFRRKWLIRLSEKQAKVALGVLEKHADGPFDLPRPDRGFICDL